ncbi:ADP-ribosylglycohydrolase family protein [Actinomycetaceae bacterium L2_0104]
MAAQPAAGFGVRQPVPLTPEIIDRARGTLLASACGDALGVPYEFAKPPQNPEMIGGGLGPYEPGEWSDDTQMAACIAQAVAAGASPLKESTIDAIAENFLRWLREGASDVGTQTRWVLNMGEEAGQGGPGRRLKDAARTFSEGTDRAAGNGALMRTAPVGLTFLDSQTATAQAAVSIAQLTHYDPLVDESVILWSEAIRNAVLIGETAIRPGLDLLRSESRDYWVRVIDAAEAGDINPHQNGFTVGALQCSWNAVYSVRHLAGEEAVARGIKNAVRLGADTDTIAAIAGGLLGAAYGAEAVPHAWKEKVHGWPGFTGEQYADLGRQIVEASNREI